MELYKRGKVVKMSTGTKDRKLALTKHAFTLATREWELARDNPVKRVSLARDNNVRDRWLDQYEERKLPDASPVWLQEIIIFATNAGMRLEEILSLRWKYVDLNRAVATIMKTKNKERRTIPLNQVVLGHSVKTVTIDNFHAAH